MGSLSFSFSIRLELTRKFNRIARMEEGREGSFDSIDRIARLFLLRSCAWNRISGGGEEMGNGERGVCEECNYSRENDERHLLY